MRTSGWVMTMVVCAAGFGGCQQIDGECWPVSEDGQGAGVGGGPVVPGTGGFGDMPPEPQTASDSPPPECIGEESFAEVRCKRADWGVECMIKCGEAGLACRARIDHPHKPEVGDLRKCKGTSRNEQCWYIFPDGNECVWRRDTNSITCEM